jgi:hypothetical protein
MNLSDRYKVNQEVIHQTIDGEVIIVNLGSGNYYSLDKIGALIWNYIEKNESVGEMINNIYINYDCTIQELRDAVSELISSLMDEKLILPNPDSHTKGDNIHTQLENNPTEQKNKFDKPRLGKYSDMQELLLLDPIHEVDETGWPNPGIQKD